MAVYTEVSDQELARFLTRYDIGTPIRKTPIAEGVENTNYRLETDRGVYILTLFEKRTRAEDLPFFMDLTAHLAAKGLSIPAPVKMKDGAVISTLCGRPAAIITFLQGRPIMLPDPPACAGFGAAVASLHASVADFDQTRDNPLSLDGWRALADACGDRADECASGLGALIEEELAMLTGSWPQALPRGVVHADLFPDNVFFIDGEISGFIDFYFSCTEFFAYDLAIAVNAWCFDKTGGFHRKNALELMNAYQSERALSAEEKKAFPILLRGSALRFLMTRLYDWLNQDPQALVTVKNPLEYRDIILFHRQNFNPRDYGLTDD